MDSLRDKLFAIVRATYTHASNLACFVIVYKSVCLLLLKVFSHGSRHLHTLVGAFLGGYFVFGAKNNINEQVSTLFGSFHFFSENDLTN